MKTIITILLTVMIMLPLEANLTTTTDFSDISTIKKYTDQIEREILEDMLENTTLPRQILPLFVICDMEKGKEPDANIAYALIKSETTHVLFINRKAVEKKRLKIYYLDDI